MDKQDKQGKMARVAEQTARLVMRHGIEGVTHAKLARAAHVSRPWLYKYVGRERGALIAFMVDHFGLGLAELDRRPRCDTRQLWEQDSVEGVAIMADHAARAPWLLPLYFRYVGTDNPIGARIEEIERRYLDTTQLELQRVGIARDEHARQLASQLLGVRLGLVQRVQRATDDAGAVQLAQTLFAHFVRAL